MIDLRIFSQPGPVDALAWTLLHFLWQGALLGVAAFALLRLARPERAATRYAIGVATLAVMLITCVTTFVVLSRQPAPIDRGGWLTTGTALAVKPAVEENKEIKAETKPADAAAAAPLAGANPPSSGDGAAPPSAPAESAAPPPPIDTTGAGSLNANKEAEEQVPAKKSSPIGTIALIGALAIGVGIVVRLTMRRRKEEDITIFDKSPAPRAPRPPIAHHP